MGESPGGGTGEGFGRIAGVSGYGGEGRAERRAGAQAGHDPISIIAGGTLANPPIRAIRFGEGVGVTPVRELPGGCPGWPGSALRPWVEPRRQSYHPSPAPPAESVRSTIDDGTKPGRL